MGVVYEAEQLSLGRRVALKVLPLHVAKDGRALERFRREARSAAKLHHTNIVPVFEVGQEGDVCYYAMQLIQGQGLDQVIARAAPVPLAGRAPSRAVAAPPRPGPRPCARETQTRRDRPRGADRPVLDAGAGVHARVPRLGADPRGRPRACPTSSRIGDTTSRASPGSSTRRRRRWPSRTSAGSSTATSSRRTCSWTPRGSSGSPTSAWPRRPAATT